MRALIFFLLICFLVADFSFGKDQNIPALIEKGNHFFKEKKYDQALNCYREIEKRGYSSPDLYYNIGTAYYKVDSLGMASLYLHRAQKLSPFDEDISFNLQLVNTQTIDKLESFPVFFLLRWWNSFLSVFHPDNWARISIVLLLAACTFLVLFWFTSAPEKRSLFLILFITLAGFFLLSFFVAYGAYNKNSSQQNFVVISNSAEIYSAPSTGSTRLFIIHEGAAGEIVEVQDDFTQVRFPNGTKGWINHRQIGKY